MEKMIKIYSGVFLDPSQKIKGHMTFDFDPGNCILPGSTEPGDRALLRVVGNYSDDEGYEALIVRVVNPRLSHQLNGETVLHISTGVPEGGTPVETGVRASSRGWKPLEEEYLLKGTWDFFQVPDKS